MNKSRLLFSTAFFAAIAVQPISAQQRANNNVLGNAPVMSRELQKPPAELDAKQMEADSIAKASVENQEEKPLFTRKSAPAGVPLPAIVASVYDYATNTIGMYRLPEVSGGEMEKISDVSSYYGGAFDGTKFYACDDGRYTDYWDTDSDPHGHRIQAYDIDSWEPIGNPINLSTYRATDLTIHPANGLGYAFCDYGSMMYHLYSIDMTTGAQTNLTPSATFLDDNTRALSFNSDGVLYGVTKDGYFGTVSLENGKNSKMKKLPIGSSSSQYGWTSSFDPDSGQFLFMYNGSPDYGTTVVSELYSIDPDTGNATLIADFTGKCITSMFVMPDAIADTAPGQTSDPVADFAGGSLSGQVSFTMPTTLHDGSAANGTATWTIYDGSENIATGTAAYGADVTADVTVANGGKHTLAIAASNAAGEGKKSRTSLWIGVDIPLAPANVAVDFNEESNTFTVTWDAVTDGLNGGYVNPANVRYTVKRLPADVTIAENIAGTSATETYASEGIESVQFSIIASQGELVSEPALSTPCVTGSLTLPYSLADSQNPLDNWTIVDVNGDNKTWTYTSYNGVHYPYASANTADDWAITPPIKGVSGAKYQLHFKFKNQSASYPEKVAVYYGYAASPEAMTNEIMPVTIINQTDGISYDFDIIPDRDGKLFIGIHAVSDPNMYYLKMPEFTISAPVTNQAPAAPVITEVNADRSGALTATGKVTVPSQTSTGAPITSVDKIEIRRDNVIAATISNPAPGSTATFTDTTIPENSEVTYIAYAFAGEQSSSPSEPVKTFVGINRPGEIGGITIVRNAEDPGKVDVAWQTAATDWQGYPLNGTVTYNVEVYPDNAYFHGNKTYEGITDNHFTLTPTFQTGRDCGFVFVKVSAVNTAGNGYAGKSANIYVGEPMAVPFHESFPNYTLEHPWGDGDSNGPQIASISDDERAISFQQFNGWNRMMDKSFQSSEGSQDGDNGFAGMFGWSYAGDTEGNYHNEWTELISPAVNLGSLERPMLTFYTFNWLKDGFSDPNTIEVDVLTADGQRHNVVNQVIGELGSTQSWENISADLSAYKGQTVSFIFKGTIRAQGDRGYNWVLIDNIRVEQIADTDLAALDIEAPVQARPNEEFTVKARISNLGSEAVSSHSATLYHNGESVAAKELGSLATNRSETVEFNYALGVQDPIGNVFTIAVETPGDKVADNNMTGEVTVARNLQLLPEPTNVRVAADGSLTWEAPDMENAAPAPLTDDFEAYTILENESFLTEAGDWIFIDVDQAPIGGVISSSTMEIINFPGIENHSAQSWWVQSRLFDDFNDTYFGNDHSIQYLANMYVVNDRFNAGVQQDDWAITPELCGREQLLTLWAKSYNRETPETVEFLYSEGGTTPDAFTLIRRIDQLPGDWTQYALVIPEGGRRFAIRGCSYNPNGTNQTFVDDVTFVPAEGEQRNLTVSGYNIYKDAELLTATPVSDLQFAGLPDSFGTYYVSAVYPDGESRAVKASTGVGVGSVNAASLNIAVRDGEIVITGLQGEKYSVVSASGIILAAGADTDRANLAVDRGIYLVKAGNTIRKVVVR